MIWIKENKNQLPIKSWCRDLEEGALIQAENLSRHPVTHGHIALMPDSHQGYGMPIGGVIAAKNAVIPNAVGVDIGCGMGAVKTTLQQGDLGEKKGIRKLLELVKCHVPIGEGHAHKEEQHWKGFSDYLTLVGIGEPLEENASTWLNPKIWKLAAKNLGTLGGGNHFIEIQKDEEDQIWLMLHSGSRNLGYGIAKHYHALARKLNRQWHVELPSEELAFLPEESTEGLGYIRDMRFALDYALENRARMMQAFKGALQTLYPQVEFLQEINIHHNYASLEQHGDGNFWIHRKGATSAKKGEMGIIPGSMGTSSYIVRGKGNPESFMSCSHGAGRKMSRTKACEQLNRKECDRSMEGVVFDRWKTQRKRGKKSPHGLDLSEAPLAYKNIDQVIEDELDLIEPMVKLSPLGVIKG